MALMLLSGDIELNPGPSAPFMVCTLNIGSILNSAHSIALSDIVDSHHPDLFCLTETWIKPTTTPAELIDCTMPGYTLISHPRTPRFQKSRNVGGGTAFLVREPFSQIPSTISACTSFEASAITLKLRSSKLTVFKVFTVLQSPLTMPNHSPPSSRNFTPSYAPLPQHRMSS